MSRSFRFEELPSLPSTFTLSAATGVSGFIIVAFWRTGELEACEDVCGSDADVDVDDVGSCRETAGDGVAAGSETAAAAAGAAATVEPLATDAARVGEPEGDKTPVSINDADAGADADDAEEDGVGDGESMGFGRLCSDRVTPPTPAPMLVVDPNAAVAAVPRGVVPETRLYADWSRAEADMEGMEPLSMVLVSLPDPLTLLRPLNADAVAPVGAGEVADARGEADEVGVLPRAGAWRVRRRRTGFVPAAAAAATKALEGTWRMDCRSVEAAEADDGDAARETDGTPPWICAAAGEGTAEDPAARAASAARPFVESGWCTASEKEGEDVSRDAAVDDEDEAEDIRAAAAAAAADE